MWTSSPELSLWLVRRRELELARTAERHRLSRARLDGSASRLTSRLLGGTRKRVERLTALVGSTFSSHEAPCNDPCPDGASG